MKKLVSSQKLLLFGLFWLTSGYSITLQITTNSQKVAEVGQYRVNRDGNWERTTVAKTITGNKQACMTIDPQTELINVTVN